MAQIHYFPRYSQRENFETNNTLLLLYQLYNFNRFRFEKFLSGLLGEAITEAGNEFRIGLQINQQVARKGMRSGIVDGYLFQDSLRIAIETKRSANAFSTEQLSRHLDAFGQSSGGFLILLSPERAQIEVADWQKLAADATERNVILVPVTFEKLIDAARNSLTEYDEEMHALITDYEEFCSEEELLPVDQWTLFVPPCGLSHGINTRHHLYYCPSSWSRRKARYLGVYYDKAVRHLGRISKVVECEITDGNVTSETVPLTNGERKRIAAAATEAMEQQGWDITTGRQFFLCDDMCDTLFRKSSPGGIMGHRYFDLRDYFSDNLPSQLREIAEGLRSHQWE